MGDETIRLGGQWIRRNIKYATTDAEVEQSPLTKPEKINELSYRMARHLANTDEIHPLTWGVQAMNLLAELRNLDPERYDREVKRSRYLKAVESTQDTATA